MKPSALLPFLSALSITACIAPPATPWDQAIVAAQSFADKATVDSAFPFTQTADSMAQIGGLASQGTSACPQLVADFGGTALDAKRAEFAQELADFAKDVALIGLAALGPAHDLVEALEAADRTEVARLCGMDLTRLNALFEQYKSWHADLAQKLADGYLDTVVDWQVEQVSPRFVFNARTLLAHELVHTLQQRGGGTLPKAINDALDELKKLEVADNDSQQAESLYFGGVQGMFQRCRESFGTVEYCEGARETFAIAPQAAEISAGRAEQLSALAKSRHDIALNAIRNMK